MTDADKGKKMPSMSSPKPKQNGRMPTGRARSNSRSSGSRVQPSFDHFDATAAPEPMGPVVGVAPFPGTGAPSTITIQPIVSSPKAVTERRPLPPPAFSSRNRYTHILILKSLNGTFETKYLVIPFKPDALKLGRPVVSSNSTNGNNNGGSGSSKRDASSMVKPDNGNFDSRVLSRNHASLSCDSKTGKIYIRDLKSSNGTFVNGNRIDQTDVELKVGDVIDLGTDIDTKFEHRKISAFVEEISVIPLIDNITELPNSLAENAGKDANGPDTVIAKTIQGHVQTPEQSRDGLFQNTRSNQFASTSSSSGGGDPYKSHIHPTLSVTASTAQRAAFEAAMFGDVNNLDIEDAVLGPETEILSGIFINNSIGTSPNLINIIKTLATEIALEKQESMKLKSIENFLVNYTTNLEYVNKLMIEMNDKQLVKLQNSLKQQFTEKHDSLIDETKQKIEQSQKDAIEFKSICSEKNKQDGATIRHLEMELEDLKTRLEVEKYKNSKLQNSSQASKQQDNKLMKDLTKSETSDPKNVSDTSEKDNLITKKSEKGTFDLKSKSLIAITAVSVGFIALLVKFTTK
ncbi:Vps64 protein [Maudiozyma humilis]|uniref:Vps64 protein n=1 Tax=Maudiozyma humilis TaxID=51915 RepID=A0AAV5RXR8_MAUHU|nr:Vps64 protein [Kazachstania humilis]